MNDVITMDADVDRLISNLTYTFSRNTTFIHELLQNARRSGACRVTIDTVQDDDGNTRLTLVDDGHGIRDFAEMFCLGSTGWQDSDVESEHPFGMGFLSAIMAADTIRVASRGRVLETTSQALIRREPVKVAHCEETVAGTSIVLSGINLRKQIIDETVESGARGLTMPVVLNGEVCRNDHARHDDNACVDVGVGTLVNPDFERNIVLQLYLNGQPLAPMNRAGYGFMASGFSNTALHLDPRQFAARLPDRDRLIDEDEARIQIEDALRDRAHTYYMDKRQSMAPCNFIERYYARLRSWRLSYLINDLPVLPASFFDTFEDDILLHGDNIDSMMGPRGGPVSQPVYRDDTGRPLVVRDDIREGEVTERAYARAAGVLCLNTQLPGGHWLEEIEDVSDLSVQAQVQSVNAEVPVRSGGPCINLVLCESVAISGPAGTFVVDDTPVEIEAEGWPVAFPSKSDACDVDRAVSFYDGDNEQVDCDELERFISILTPILATYRAGDSASLIEEQMQDLLRRVGGSLPSSQAEFSLTIADGKVSVQAVA